MPASREISTQLFVSIILFSCILLLGFLQRIDTMYTWDISPDQFLIEQEPMLANLDGYYYLNIAREIQQNTYSSRDALRAYPESVQRSSLPPLLSIIIAYGSTIIHKSLSWTGIFIPASLGILMAVPLFLFGLRWGGPIMGLTASIIGIMAPVYASRTSLAVLDTDCLNVTFPLICAYLFIRFATESGKTRYLFLGAGLLCYLLFAWWWDQSLAAATALGLSPLLIGLVFFYRPKKREEAVFLIICCGAVILLLSWLGWETPVRLIKNLMGLFSYISKQTPDLYPNIGLFITEQGTISARQLMTGTGMNIPVFLAGVTGLAWLMIKKYRETIFLLPIMAVAMLSQHAMRFTIFLPPLIGLGAGFLLANIHTLLNNNRTVPILTGLLIVFLGWQGFQRAPVRTSYYPAQTIVGMKRLHSITPDNAVIWSWWDEGHPLVYWAGRATINDGMVHSGRRTHYNALPMSMDNFRMAANFMQFYAARGLKGITRLLPALKNKNIDENQFFTEIFANGPAEGGQVLSRLSLPAVLLDFLYPSSCPPLYLFLDRRLLGQAQFIYWYGTWDTRQRSGTPTLPVINLENIPFDSQGRPTAETFSVDIDMGNMDVPTMFKQPVPLYQLTLTNKTTSRYRKYPPKKAMPERTRMFEKINPFDFILSREGLYELDLYIPANSGILQDHKQASTIINRIFWRHNEADSTFFKLVDQQMPYYQIWQVQGDKIPSSNHQDPDSIKSTFNIETIR